MKKSSRHSHLAFDWLITCPKIIKKLNKSAKKMNKQVCKNKRTNKSAKQKNKQVCKKVNKSAKK